eukprot:TRINITY_DN3651_c2_g1_i1.p1 TRINITY_DN3651_c2_g1~~TRINITY_DN3651_c2_g1_i1.p1  ORF type:complete len:111 (+),score=6.88 TRINITY_DN3651_c2_g1_i1:97-429(+)
MAIKYFLVITAIFWDFLRKKFASKIGKNSPQNQGWANANFLTSDFFRYSDSEVSRSVGQSGHNFWTQVGKNWEISVDIFGDYYPELKENFVKKFDFFWLYDRYFCTNQLT